MQTHSKWRWVPVRESTLKYQCQYLVVEDNNFPYEVSDLIYNGFDMQLGDQRVISDMWLTIELNGFNHRYILSNLEDAMCVRN